MMDKNLKLRTLQEKSKEKKILRGMSEYFHLIVVTQSCLLNFSYLDFI